MADVQVLFVCTGNICRSPTAEGVLRHLVDTARLSPRVGIDSAGLGGWHVGDAPDPRAVRTAAARGYDLSDLRARQFHDRDYHDFDLIVGMDHGHMRDLRTRQPQDSAAAVQLFLDFLPTGDRHYGADVPDPYYGGLADYEHSLDLIEHAMPRLIEALARDHL